MTRYGREALDALREAVLAAKGGDPLAPVTVLVPSGLAGLVARRHLAAGLGDGHAGVAALHPTTVVRLAEQLAAPALAGRLPATGPVVTAAWRAALLDEPGLFAEVAGHPATAQALVRAGRELRDLDGDALDAIAWVPPLGADVVRLHRDVRARLAGWYDGTDLLAAAAEICRRTPARVRELGPVVAYLPQALTLAESSFVGALRAAVPGMTAVVGLTGDVDADAAVRRSLRRTGVDEPGDQGRAPVAGEVLTASDSDDEVRCVVRAVVQVLRDGTPAHRVAVLHASRDPYARLLHEHLGAAGITVNGPGTRPVHERAAVRTVLELLDAAPRGFPRGELFRALSGAPVLDPVGGRVPVARWERVSRAAGVVGGDDWDVRLGRLADDLRDRLASEQALDEPRQGRVAALQREVDDAVGLHAFVARLRTEAGRAQTLSSWSALSAWALDLVDTLLGPPDRPGALDRAPAEERYARVALTAALHGVTAVDVFGTPASLPALVQTLTEQLQVAQPRVGRFGEGVLVAPVAAAVGLDADTVFVLGLAEGLYPTRLREDPVLPERLRAESRGQLSSTRERLDSEHRALLAAFAAAPRVVASFPRGDLRTKSRYLPSRWLLPTLRALADDPALTAGEYERASQVLTVSASFAYSLTTTGSPASEQEWRTRAAQEGVLDDPVVSAARSLHDGRRSGELSRFDGDLRGTAEGLPDFTQQPVSPTVLERYAGCPHAFLVRDLLRVEPVDSPEDLVVVSPADVGTLMHAAFDSLVRNHRDSLPGHGEPWREEHHWFLDAEAVRLGAELAAAGLSGHPTLWARRLRAIRDDLHRMLLADDAHRADHASRVLDSELAFGVDGYPPVEVPLGDGRTVPMRGRADKVDVDAEGRLYVTDIKTGSPRTFAGISETDPVLGGSKLQLPVYAHAARDRYGDGDTEVTADYWFVRRDAGRVALQLTDDVERIYSDTLRTLVDSIRTGLFPQRPPEQADFGGWVRCPYCNPDGLGHGEARARWEHTRGDGPLADLVALIDPQPDTEEDR